MLPNTEPWVWCPVEDIVHFEKGEHLQARGGEAGGNPFEFFRFVYYYHTYFVMLTRDKPAS